MGGGEDRRELHLPLTPVSNIVTDLFKHASLILYMQDPIPWGGGRGEDRGKPHLHYSNMQICLQEPIPWSGGGGEDRGELHLHPDARQEPSH